jgi:hypothetical protein
VTLSFTPRGRNNEDVEQLLLFLRDGFAEALHRYQEASRPPTKSGPKMLTEPPPRPTS